MIQLSMGLYLSAQVFYDGFIKRVPYLQIDLQSYISHGGDIETFVNLSISTLSYYL